MKYLSLLAVLGFAYTANAGVSIQNLGVATMEARTIAISPTECLKTFRFDPQTMWAECSEIDAAAALAESNDAQVSYQIKPEALQIGNEQDFYYDDMQHNLTTFIPLPNGYRFRMRIVTNNGYMEVRPMDMEAALNWVISVNGGASFRAIVVRPAQGLQLLR